MYILTSIYNMESLSLYFVKLYIYINRRLTLEPKKYKISSQFLNLAIFNS